MSKALLLLIADGEDQQQITFDNTVVPARGVKGAVSSR